MGMLYEYSDDEMESEVEQLRREAKEAKSMAHVDVTEPVRLAAEHTELRTKYTDLDSMYNNHREGLEAELKDAEIERDRLRALVTRLRDELVDWHLPNGDPDPDITALLADLDGQAAIEWLEAEKAKIRKEALEFERVQLLSCAELPLDSPDRSLTSIVATISAKAAEPWKALAVRLWKAGRHDGEPAEKEGMDWYNARIAHARTEEHARCAALVREVGCICNPEELDGSTRDASYGIDVHCSWCPVALASRIEAGKD